MDSKALPLDKFMAQESQTELDISPWVTITQSQINQFAETTGDHQWIHVDIEKAKKESPFGGTIAHGQLTLSIASALALHMDLFPEGVKRVFNYGIDKIRFIAPVKSGNRVRNRVRFVELTPKDESNMILKTEHTLEIEGSDKPALVATYLVMLGF